MSIKICIAKINPFQANPTDFHMAAIAMAVEKLHTSSFFSICEVDNIAGLLGIRNQVMDHPDYKALLIMHCVSWDKMSTELKKQTLEKSLWILGITLEHDMPQKATVISNSRVLTEFVRSDTEIVDVEATEQKPGFMGRLSNPLKK